jgi:hypothetical protein
LSLRVTRAIFNVPACAPFRRSENGNNELKRSHAACPVETALKYIIISVAETRCSAAVIEEQQRRKTKPIVTRERLFCRSFPAKRKPKTSFPYDYAGSTRVFRRKMFYRNLSIFVQQFLQ